MKRFFHFMMAVAVIFSAASCAKENVSVAPEGQEVEVSFVADLGGALGSRAIADGTTVDEVAWAVYEDGANAPLENLQGTLKIEGKQATLNVRLATGKTYDIAFFAYKAQEAKTELKGVTLESLVVAERVARAVKKNVAKGILNAEDFPLLLHIDEIICGKKAVNIPWESFTYREEI